MKTVQELLAGLQSTKPSVRRSTLYALGSQSFITDVRLVQPLIRLLGERVVAYRSARLLAQIGDAAIPDLVPALQSYDADVRSHVVWILGQIGGPIAVEALRPMIYDYVSDVHFQAALQLALLGDA